MWEQPHALATGRYQICLFCLDRLKNECGGLCPGCRTEYGSATDPFAKRAPSSSDAATPASGSSRSSSPVVASAASAAAPAAPAATAGLTPLEQARQMHRAAQQVKRAAAAATAAQEQAAAIQPRAGSQAASQPPPAPPPQQPQPQQQQQRRQQQPRPAAPQLQPQQLRLPDATVQPPSSLASACAAWPEQQPQQPIGNRVPSASGPLDTSALQPAAWLGPGASASSAAGGMACSSGEASLANGMLGSGSGSSGSGSPWGSGPAGPVSGTPQRQGPPRRMAAPLRPLPLEGGRVVAADPGAEADLAVARLAVQCGQLSASDAAWNLLSARASVCAV